MSKTNLGTKKNNLHSIKLTVNIAEQHLAAKPLKVCDYHAEQKHIQ